MSNQKAGKARMWAAFAASFELVFAASLWGFGFVAVIWGLESWTPVQLLFLRFLIGGTAGILLSSFVINPLKIQWKLAFWLALALSVMALLQTWGLRYTTATKSG